jgi:hypothetical protein
VKSIEDKSKFVTAMTWTRLDVNSTSYSNNLVRIRNKWFIFNIFWDQIFFSILYNAILYRPHRETQAYVFFFWIFYLWWIISVIKIIDHLYKNRQKYQKKPNGDQLPIFQRFLGTWVPEEKSYNKSQSSLDLSLVLLYKPILHQEFPNFLFSWIELSCLVPVLNSIKKWN